MSMRNIYRKIAKQNGVSVEEVKQEMQRAIDAAWDNPNKTHENIYTQNQIKADGTKPTVDEFLRASSDTLKKKL